MKPRICHISSVHPVTDTRVFYKECCTLAEAGYETILVARDEGQPRTVDDVRIVPFHLYKNRFKRILLSPFRMLRIALQQKAKLYHFHDPELLPVGIMLKLLGKKVIYDVHENFAKQILDKSYLKNRFTRKFLARLVRWFENFGSLFFNHIVPATPSIAENFKAAKTTVVRNVPLIKMFNSTAVIETGKKKPVIIYVGVLSQGRGLIEMVQAMEYIGDKAELWLVGNWERREIHEKCMNLPGWQAVRYLGFKPQDEAYGYMKMGDVAIVNFLPLANHVEALPNKIFEYMVLGLPLVISNFPYWIENFEPCALFADPQDPHDIAAKINEYLDNENLREQKGRNGKEMIAKGFSWEHQQTVLLDVYRRVLPDMGSYIATHPQEQA